MEVLSTPRCKPEPPKTASPMPEAGFLTAVVLSMPGSIVEPINNSTEGQVRGELGPPSGEPVLWVGWEGYLRLGRSSRIGNRQSETGYWKPVLIPIMVWLWIIQWVPRLVVWHSTVLVVDTVLLISSAMRKLWIWECSLCKLCKCWKNSFSLFFADRSNR